MICLFVTDTLYPPCVFFNGSSPFPTNGFYFEKKFGFYWHRWYSIKWEKNLQNQSFDFSLLSRPLRLYFRSIIPCHKSQPAACREILANRDPPLSSIPHPLENLHTIRNFSVSNNPLPSHHSPLEHSNWRQPQPRWIYIQLHLAPPRFPLPYGPRDEHL